MTINRRHVLAALLIAFNLTHSQPAHADPPEQFAQVAVHPANADVIALRYAQSTEGIFFSTDRGATWALTCSSGIDPGITKALAAGVASDGTVMVTGILGADQKYVKSVWQAGISGCGFSRVSELADTWLSDIEAHPTDPNVMFGVSSGLDGDRLNGLWKRNAAGEWSSVGSRERMMISSLRITTTTNGLRMYQSALREMPAADAGVDGGGAPTYGFVLRVSDDEGQSWEEHPVEVSDRSGSFRLEAIDPKDPDTIVASILIPGGGGVSWKDSKDLVLVSKDRGETFETFYAGAELGAARFTADGTLWIGDNGPTGEKDAPKGLWKATSLDASPVQVSELPTPCLTYQPASDTLYACQRYSMGSVDQATGEVTLLLQAVTATHIASCAGQDVVAACERELCRGYCGLGHFAQSPLCRAYDTPTCGPSAGIMDGTIDAGVWMSSSDATTPTPDASTHPVATNPRGDCGCDVLGSRGRSDASGFCTVAMLFTAARRLRRHTRCTA